MHINLLILLFFLLVLDIIILPLVCYLTSLNMPSLALLSLQNCRILYLVFSLLYIMMLFSLYILFLVLTYTITRLTLFFDSFSHNSLSTLFLGLYVILDVLSLAYDSFLLNFPLFHHTVYSISIMIFLIMIFCFTSIVSLHNIKIFGFI